MAAATLRAGRIEQLPLAKIAPDPHQPRKAFDAASLEALADNLKARGVLQPILVRAGTRIGSYVIVDGERRWRAAKLAKLKTVPVTLHQNTGTDVELLVDQVAANNLREQLSAMELARFLRDLRDRQKLSANEIAAALVKHGLKAMKRQEVEAQLLLTDLPGWAADLIDAGTLDVNAAPAILRGMKIPGIAEDLRKLVQQRVNWSGIAKQQDAWEAVDRAACEKHADLTATDSWHQKPVHFDHKTRCKGCEHYHAGHRFAVCSSAKLFAAHNQEAKDAGLGPGGTKPKQAEPAQLKEGREAKAKEIDREMSIERKAQEYLHCWLLKRMDADGLASKSPYHEALVLWAAARYPGAFNGCGSSTPQRVATLFGVERTRLVASLWTSLDTFLAVFAQGSVVTCTVEISGQILNSLDFNHLLLIARHAYGSNLSAIWRMDEAYTLLFRKAELVHQLEQSHVPLPDGRKSWSAMSAGQLRAALLEHARTAEIDVPVILDTLYAKPFEVYSHESWRSGGDDEADDDDSADALILDDEDDGDDE